MSIWDEAKKNLVEWYGVTADKTTEIAKVTSRKYDRFGLSRDIERQFSELGSLIYNGLREERTDVLESPAVSALVERIAELETELRRKEEEIETIKREHASRKAAESAAGGAEAARVITDPALMPGSPDSAILVEEKPETPENAAFTDEKDKDNPENIA